jgi:hypothetical protein
MVDASVTSDVPTPKKQKAFSMCEILGYAAFDAGTTRNKCNF